MRLVQKEHIKKVWQEIKVMKGNYTEFLGRMILVGKSDLIHHIEQVGLEVGF